MVLHVSDRLSIIIWVKETIRTLTPLEGWIASLPMNDIRQELMLKLQIVKDAKALIADRKNWTQGALARDDEGVEVSPDREEATCRCGEGAIEAAFYARVPERVARRGLDLFSEIRRRAQTGYALCDVNDGVVTTKYGHDPFLAVHGILDATIKSFEQELEALDAQ